MLLGLDQPCCAGMMEGIWLRDSLLCSIRMILREGEVSRKAGEYVVDETREVG